MTNNNIPTLPALPKLPKLPRQHALRPCECGCGRDVPRRFAPGHDSRLRGTILRVRTGVMSLDEVANLIGIGCAEAAAEALGIEWRHGADTAKSA